MKKRTVGVLLAAFFAMALTGCGDKQPQPGEVKGYDKGEEYLSIWVHSIEDTEEGQCYRKSVDAFNKDSTITKISLQKQEWKSRMQITHGHGVNSQRC